MVRNDDSLGTGSDWTGQGSSGGDWFAQNSPAVVTTGATTQPVQAAPLPAGTPSLGANIASGASVGAQGDPAGSGATPGNPAPADSGYPGLSAADKATIDGLLKNAQSTDDPTYWYNLAVQHGGVAGTGLDWLTTRINQGDGALAVRNGTVQPFQDTSAPAAPAAAASTEDLLAPYTKTFDYAPFTAPDSANESNDPGFQERLATGEQALQRSAASKGTLLTGGTAKDLTQYGQDYASNEYANVYNRAANDYNTNRNNAYQQYLGDESTFYANQNNPFAKLLAVSTA